MNIQENVDYALLPEPVWNELSDWCGCQEYQLRSSCVPGRYGGGPAYPRQVISVAGKMLRVEMYPYYISFLKCDEKGEPGKFS